MSVRRCTADEPRFGVTGELAILRRLDAIDRRLAALADDLAANEREYEELRRGASLLTAEESMLRARHAALQPERGP